jgi:Zn-dependent M28 family amino/carboxypeptidase
LQIYYCNEYSNWFALPQLFWLPFYGLLLFFTNWIRIVQGANDNLSGCVISMAVAKFMFENGIKLENTEVKVLLSGCEESGLRGAKAYARVHPPEGIEAAFIAFDCVRDLDKMRIYNREMAATVALDQRVCNIMQKGGNWLD